jgi:hypothetical protein
MYTKENEEEINQKTADVSAQGKFENDPKITTKMKLVAS